MTSLGPVTYRRARYRSGASGASPVPVDESLGLVDDYLTRPAAELGLLMMGRCTAREAAAFFAKTGAMTPSVSTLQRLTLSMHECWESLGPETLGSIREAEGIPQDATTASVSLDGVMVPLRPGEDGRAKASWREAACGTVSFHDAEGKRLKTLYLGRMPESGKLTLKAQLASEVAHIRRARPEIGIVAIADGAADNWTFLETLSPETEVIDFWHACEHLQTASDHAVAPGWFEKYREILRHDPRGVAKVIRALRHLRDAAAAPDRAETERELAFFRKHRHRMRYHALKEEGIAIGSGVVEAANKTLVTQRMKRSGMRWRIVGGQAVLTFRALIKSGRFERLGATVEHDGEPNASGIASVFPVVELGVRLSMTHLDGTGDGNLVVNTTAFPTRSPANPGFVHLNMVLGLSTDPVLVGPHHARAELVENLKGRLVARKTKLPLKLHGGHAGRLTGDQISGPEPDVQRSVATLHHCSHRQPGVLAALAAAQVARAVFKVERLSRRAAVRAGKAVSPAGFLQVGGAGRIIGEKSLELG